MLTGRAGGGFTRIASLAGCTGLSSLTGLALLTGLAGLTWLAGGTGGGAATKK